MARRKIISIRQGTVVVYGFYTNTRTVDKDRLDINGDPEIFQVEMPLYESFSLEINEVGLRRVLKGLKANDVEEGVLETGQVTLDFGLSNAKHKTMSLPLNSRTAVIAHTITNGEKNAFSDNGVFAYFSLGHVDSAKKGGGN